MLKMFGFGIQEEVLLRLIEYGIESIVITTKTKDFKSTINDWLRHGKTKDFGHGRQVFLSMKFME